VRRAAAGTGLLAVLFACASVDRAGVLAVVEAYEAAVNRRDVEAQTALFAEDARWWRDEVLAYEGREAIGRACALDAATRARLDLEVLSIRGSAVRCRADKGNELCDALGLGEVRQEILLEVRGGRIRGLRALPPSDPGVEEGISAFAGWLRATHPDEAGRLLGEDGAAPDEEEVRRLVELARRWRAEG